MNEFLTSLITSVTASAALTGVLVWLSKTWLSERLKHAIKHEYDAQLEVNKATLKAQFDEKIETHKAQLKAQTDVENERLKSQLSILAAEHQVRFSGLHNKRAEVISEIYALLVQAHWDGASFASPLEFSGDLTKREKYSTAMQSLNELYRGFQRKRLYIPEHVCDLIDPLIEGMRHNVISFGTSLQYGEEEWALDSTLVDKHRVWIESWQYFEKDVPTARRALEFELRHLLGDAQLHLQAAPEPSLEPEPTE